MSGPMPAVTVFSLTSSSAQAATTMLVSEADEEDDALLTPVEQLATAFYEDTRALVRSGEVDLPAAFDAPLPYADDPELFLRLLAADVERLWTQQVAGSLALVVTSAVSPSLAQPVLYRGLYRLRPTIENDDAPPPRPIRRTVGRIETALGQQLDVRACLVVQWSRDPAVRRARLAPPRYAFAWEPVSIARFNEQALAPADRFDPSGRPPRPDEELRILRLAVSNR
ncbi:MAG TPA: hypothetical protein VF120_10845 [Ktedonobacterales bacterium]